MARQLRAIILEDSEDDALLMVRALRQGGYAVEWRREETLPGLQRALTAGPWDIIFSDYAIPEFDIRQALTLLQQHAIDVPMIVVSGNIGEETAVALMKSGVHDYIFKDNLARLVPAVDRELRDAAIRRDRRRAQEELKQYHAHLEELVKQRTAEATDRARQAEQQRARAEALLASIGDPLVAVNRQGLIRYGNEPFARLVERAPVEFIDQPLDVVVSLRREQGEVVPQAERPISRAMESGERVVTSLADSIFLHRGATAVPLLITAAPIKVNGEIQGAIAVYRDATNEKEIDQAKTEFVSMASHQLRTPLTSIGLSSELLLRGLTGAVEERQRSYVEEIHQSARRMSELVGDLLNVSRIELGTFKVQLEPINPVRNIERILEELKLQIRAKRLVINRSLEPVGQIVFDRNILRMAVENLLTNAIHYTPEQGRIDLTLSQRTGAVEIKIANWGCGIPPDQQDRIFTKSFRADNAREINPQGSGLGLYIVKSVLERVGATIRFTSPPGKETTFYVRIPTKPVTR